MPRKRHIPERTCVACGLKKPKGELRRIALSTDGQVSVDATGKAPGRGAYVCDSACWSNALDRGRVNRSFGRPVSSSQLKALRIEAPAE